MSRRNRRKVVERLKIELNPEPEKKESKPPRTYRVDKLRGVRQESTGITRMPSDQEIEKVLNDRAGELYFLDRLFFVTAQGCIYIVTKYNKGASRK